METKEIELWTDGACSGNPGPGGLGVLLKWNLREKKISKGFRRTTNNRMELLAVIEGLRAIKGKQIVHVYSDSKYVVDAMLQGWAETWRKNGFRKKKNPDLWVQLLDLCKEQAKVTFKWVEGHAGTPENERCDELARKAMLVPVLAVDEVYESESAQVSLV